MKTHTGKVVNYLQEEMKIIASSSLGGDFYGGYTTMRLSNLTPAVEGKDLVFDIVLKTLVGYREKLKESKVVTVHIEWDITDDYSEYIACRVLSVEVRDKLEESGR